MPMPTYTPLKDCGGKCNGCKCKPNTCRKCGRRTVVFAFGDGRISRYCNECDTTIPRG